MCCTKHHQMTPMDIDWSCPSDLEPYSAMYNMDLKLTDSYVHEAFGMYFMSAVSTLLEHALSKHPKSEYIKTPILQDMGMTEEEKMQRSIDEFMKKMEDMKRDWDSVHNKGE